jgi:phosphoglycerate dehydrogenase-like enzyme
MPCIGYADQKVLFPVLLAGADVSRSDTARHSNRRWNVLVTARAFHDSGSLWLQQLEQAGCQVRPASRWGPLDLASLIDQCQEIDCVIAATDPYGADFFQECPRVRLVARCGVGVDTVEVAEATRRGVLATNVPDAMTDAVADYCLGLLLCLVRRIAEGDACMRRGGWEEFPGIELRGKTLGLVGFGKIGQEVARRAMAFGMEVVTSDPMWSNLHHQMAATLAPGRSVRPMELEELLATSDVVSIHAPNTPQTRHLIDRRRLAMMKPTAVLINTARGALIDQEALQEALRGEIIAGAAIDVYQQEPLPADHPLRSTPRLLLTPHNAFNSKDAAERMSRGCAEPILDLLAGRKPKHLLDPSAWDLYEKRFGEA